METLATKSTTYDRVEKFMLHLMMLSSTELITFYCETCLERMGACEQQRPGTPLHEKTGTCCLCNRPGDVSNPSINIFLNRNGWRLDSRVTNLFDDSPAKLIRDWLMPAGYFSFHRSEAWHGEPDSLTWVKFGRQMAKNAYRSGLREESKQMLLTFYPLCYSAGRFSSKPGDQHRDKPELLATVNDKIEAKQPVTSSQPEPNDCMDLTCNAVTSKGPTLGGIQAFVSRILNYWKGK